MKTNINSKLAGGSVKWNEIYDSEEELIKDMMNCHADENSGEYWKLVKGYVYIASFQKYYTKHGALTEKQMTQLKRLAKEVYKNVHETLRS